MISSLACLSVPLRALRPLRLNGFATSGEDNALRRHYELFRPFPFLSADLYQSRLGVFCGLVRGWKTAISSLVSICVNLRNLWMNPLLLHRRRTTCRTHKGKQKSFLSADYTDFRRFSRSDVSRGDAEPQGERDYRCFPISAPQRPCVSQSCMRAEAVFASFAVEWPVLRSAGGVVRQRDLLPGGSLPPSAQLPSAFIGVHLRFHFSVIFGVERSES